MSTQSTKIPTPSEVRKQITDALLPKIRAAADRIMERAMMDFAQSGDLTAHVNLVDGDWQLRRPLADLFRSSGWSLEFIDDARDGAYAKLTPLGGNAMDR